MDSDRANATICVRVWGVSRHRSSGVQEGDGGSMDRTDRWGGYMACSIPVPDGTSPWAALTS